MTLVNTIVVNQARKKIYLKHLISNLSMATIKS